MLTTDDLNEFMRKRSPARAREQFCGAMAASDLVPPARLPASYVVNTQPANLPGRHWVALYLTTDGRGELFDSYGLAPIYRIRKFLNENCARGWSHNAKMFQSPFLPTCGAYALWFCCKRPYRESMEKTLCGFDARFLENETTVMRHLFLTTSRRDDDED